MCSRLVSLRRTHHTRAPVLAVTFDLVQLVAPLLEQACPREPRWQCSVHPSRLQPQKLIDLWDQEESKLHVFSSRPSKRLSKKDCFLSDIQTSTLRFSILDPLFSGYQISTCVKCSFCITELPRLVAKAASNLVILASSHTLYTHSDLPQRLLAILVLLPELEEKGGRRLSVLPPLTMKCSSPRAAWRAAWSY